jgi:hypothetical protein
MENDQPASPRSMSRQQILGRSRCMVCRHPDKLRIELLRAGGASLDALATKFDVSRDSLHSHWQKHVSPEQKASFLCGPGDLAALAEKAAQEGDSVLDYLRVCRTALTSQLDAVSEAGDARGVAFVTRALVHVLEAIARVTGEMGDLAKSTVFNISNTNNVAVLQDHPAFAKLQAAMLRALGPFPAAREAVVTALRSLDMESSPRGSAGPAKPDMKTIEHHVT